MHKRKAPNLQSGFTLIEILIAVGLLGVATVGVLNLTDNINTSTKNAEYLLTKSQFASLMNRYVYSFNGCDELMNLSFRPTPPSGTPLTTLNTTPIIYSRLKYEQATSIASGIKFRDFNITHFRGTVDTPTVMAPLPQVTITVGGFPTTVFKSMLNMELQIQMKRGGAQTYNYYFNLPVLIQMVGLNGTIRLCGDIQNIAETCATMGGTMSGGTCTPQAQCETGGAYEQLTCSSDNITFAENSACYAASWGGSVNNPRTGSRSCPAGFTAMETARQNWTHTVSCGKKSSCTIYDRKRWVSCFKC